MVKCTEVKNFDSKICENKTFGGKIYKIMKTNL